MRYLKSASLVALFAALEVSANLSLFETVPSLSKRGSCDSPCGAVSAADTQCKSSANYEKCVCSVDNLMAIDTCFTCLIQETELNEAANSVLTGGNSGTGGMAATTIEALKVQGQQTRQAFIDGCTAAGVSLSAGSSSSGGSTSSGSGNSGSSGGSGTSGSATTGNAAASNKVVGGSSIVGLVALAALL